MKIIGGDLLRELGREKSESYRALYSGLGWFLTVALAFLAGFANKLSDPKSVEISVLHLWVVVAAISISLRYYSRALLDYINMQAWSRLFNAYTLALASDDSTTKARELYFWELYRRLVTDWNSPVSLGKVVRDTIQIGFGHLFLLELSVLGYIVYEVKKQQGFCAIVLPLTVLLASALIEYRRLDYRRFRCVELPAQPMPPGSSPASVHSTAA